ncbi:MAG: ABC transporter substrate-binding protein, partial [Spirochaetaceae bacterium]|nr:ABC transporter substrate-binding protein [Spirochaetaceae bacterium]
MSRPAYLWFLFLMSSFSLLFASGKQQQRESTSPVPLEFPEDSQEINQGEKTFTDALGHTIYLKQPPDRIASSALFCDEILLGLIPLEKIIALSTLAGNQAYSNVYYQAMEIDVHLDFQVEPLIELNPDIIFCADWSDASKVKQLRSAGIGVFQIKTPRSMKEIRETVLLLGKILSAEEQAEQIIKTMDEMLLRIDAVVDTIPQENRLTALDYNSWGASFGDSSTWNEILDYGGIINAASSLEQDLFGQVPMTRE